MRNNTMAVARSTKQVPAGKFEAALKNFMSALGVDDETSFNLEVTPDKVVINHVNYTIKDNGVHSGDFWTEVIERGNDNGEVAKD